MSRHAGRLLAALAPFALVACGGFGAVSPKVVELYDIARPNGSMEFEFDRNGKLLEAEADIDPAQLPPAIRNAALNKAGGGEIFGAEHELQDGQLVYEVKIRKDGREWEFILDPDGTMHEIEKSLERSEAPGAVLDAAMQRIPGGSFKSVEEIQRYDAAGKLLDTEYHVKLMQDGASYKIVLSQDGSIRRAVREHMAEIEIPLKN